MPLPAVRPRWWWCLERRNQHPLHLLLLHALRNQVPLVNLPVGRGPKRSESQALRPLVRPKCCTDHCRHLFQRLVPPDDCNDNTRPLCTIFTLFRLIIICIYNSFSSSHHSVSLDNGCEAFRLLHESRTKQKIASRHVAIPTNCPMIHTR